LWRSRVRQSERQTGQHAPSMLAPGAFFVRPKKPRVATRGLRARKPPRQPCAKIPAPLPRNVHTHGTWDRDPTRSPPASAGGFLWRSRARQSERTTGQHAPSMLSPGLFRASQKAPGGNPGTPGTKTTPPSMPHDGTSFPGAGLLVSGSRPRAPGSRVRPRETPPGAAPARRSTAAGGRRCRAGAPPRASR